MRNILRDLKAAVAEFFAPWPEPDEDVLTPAAVQQWLAGLRHDPTCDGTDNCGCAT